MTTEALQKIRAEARRWLGTPHRNKMAILGPNGGIDCVYFVLQCYKAAGVVPLDFRPPNYDPDEGLHNPSTRIQELVRGFFRVQEIPVEELLSGDLLVFRNGGISGHVGLFLDDEVWHSLGHQCVTRSPWVLWRHRVHTAFRLA